jgi:nitronate monooxygenase
MGADGGYAGSAFIATEEANAVERYKEMIVESGADDIVYSDLFTGVWGNYLKPSIAAAGMDPDNLDRSDPSTMDFGPGRSKPKSWKEIWGSGQGIGAVTKVVPTAELVNRLEAEYIAAQDRLAATLGWTRA